MGFSWERCFDAAVGGFYHRAMMRVNMVPSGGVGGDSDADLRGDFVFKGWGEARQEGGLGRFYIYIYMYIGYLNINIII